MLDSLNIRWLLFCCLFYSFFACQESNKPVNDANNTVFDEFVRVRLIGDSLRYQELFDAFERKTGIHVVVSTAANIMEESYVVGDVLVSDEVAQLIEAKEEGLLKAVETDVLDEHSPLAYRDVDYYWFGLGKTMQLMVYNPLMVDSAVLDNYLGLGDSKWYQKLALSGWDASDKRTWLAAMIANKGIPQIEDWLGNLIANSRTVAATPIQGIELVASSKAALTVVSSNIIGLYLKNNPALKKQLALFVPNQKTTGVHQNLSGAGLMKGALKEKNAIQLLTFLTGADAQELLVKQCYYPTNPSVDAPVDLPMWEALLIDPLDYSFLYKNKATVKELLAKQLVK